MSFIFLCSLSVWVKKRTHFVSYFVRVIVEWCCTKTKCRCRWGGGGESDISQLASLGFDIFPIH